MNTSVDSPRVGARRTGWLVLVLAWILVLLAVGTGVAYLLLMPLEGPGRPVTQVRMVLPPPAESVARTIAEPPVPLPARSLDEVPPPADEDAPDRQDAEPTAEAPAPPPVPPATTDAGITPSPPPPADESDGGERAPPPEDRDKPAVTARPATQQNARAPLIDPTASESRPAWQRYARRLVAPEGLPKIAVVVRGLGLSSAASEAAITRLPPTVSLSFSPYARERARIWAMQARREGHEVLIDLPMEPADYPAQDPGPQAMSTRLNAAQNLQRLDWLLGQADEEVGVVADMGSAFLAEPQAVEPVFRELDARGLMYLDNGVLRDNPALDLARKLGLPHAVNDRTLDGGQVSRPAIQARLVEAERVARQDGLAVVLAHPFPVTIDVLESWTTSLERRGFVLVPATYAAVRRTGAATANLR